jgi:dTDP-glucose 4,6-dehydratase
MKIAVLGSNSFSGQDFICRALDEPDTEVLGISRSPEKHPMFLGYLKHPNVGRFEFDQCDIHFAESVMDRLDEFRPDYIVNFAAQSEVAPSWDFPEHWTDTNVTALAKLVNELRQRDYLKRWLQISTPEVYGSTAGSITEDAPLNPTTPYAVSKAAADMMLDVYRRQYGFPVVTVRSANVCGPRQQLHKLIPRAIITMKRGEKVQLHGGGIAKRSWIHIRDVSEGEWLALTRGTVGEAYHLSTPNVFPVRLVVEQIARELRIPYLEAVTETPPRPGSDARYHMDSTRARRALGWAPRQFREPIEETIQWVNDHWPLIQSQPLEYRHAA